jgi:phosphoglucosamine mutase
VARLFGTDGVRGRAGADLTRDLAFGLGRATVVVLGRHGDERPVLLVGRDTRDSGAWLEEALVDGIRSAGGDAILVGVEPTPAIAFLTTELNASSGVVISASHNPPEDNGIKFFGGDGMKLSDALEDEIEAALGEPAMPAVTRGELRDPDAGRERYLEHLVASADAQLDGLSVVVDCANGSASGFAPDVLRRLGATVHPIFDHPDGLNINVGCGALHPDVVASEVVRRGADAGVAHDGDADRALFADAAGSVIDGDQVLAACAMSMKERGTLNGNTVVTTVMANLGFHRAMREASIEVVAAPVGDRYVLEAMLERGAVLGGEQSGHVIFREQATTGDGLLTAVRFLSLAAEKGIGLRELAACMRRFPQVLLNVPVGDADGLESAERVWEAVRVAERELGDRGRVLVRSSGTEPLVRVMVEADTEGEAISHATVISRVVSEALA